MNCRKAKNVIFEYMDGLTDESLRLDLERHLASCRECEVLASSLRDSLDLLHRVPQEALDENFNWKVRLAIHRERGALQERVASQGALFGAWNFRYAASAAAGFVAILAGGWLVVNLALSPATRQTQTDTPATAMTTNDTSPSPRNGLQPGFEANRGRLVTQGAQPFRSAASQGGAIDMMNQPAQFDSLLHHYLHAELMKLDQALQAEYLKRYVAVLERCGDECGVKKHE